MLTNHVEIPVPSNVMQAFKDSGFGCPTNQRGQECLWQWWAGTHEVSFVDQLFVDPSYGAPGGTTEVHVHNSINIDSGLIEGAVKKALQKGAMDFTEELAKL